MEELLVLACTEPVCCNEWVNEWKSWRSEVSEWDCGLTSQFCLKARKNNSGINFPALQYLFDRDARVRSSSLSARLSRMSTASRRRVCLLKCVCVHSSTSGFCFFFFLFFYVSRSPYARALHVAVRGFRSALWQEGERRWQIITGRGFSGVCLRLAPLPNERCSISLIMPQRRRLMSLFSGCKVCRKAPAFVWVFF